MTPISQPQTQPLPTSPKIAPPRAKAVPPSPFSTTIFSSTLHSRQTLQPLGSEAVVGGKPGPLQQQIPKPTYNMTLPAISHTPISTSIASVVHFPLAQPSLDGTVSTSSALTSSPLFPTQPVIGSVLTPSKPTQEPWNATKKLTSADWSDFDPLA